MSNSGTTTWYAFQDPKTGREYFHEPKSGDTSWVLPTSSNTNTTTRSKIKIEKGASGSRPKAGGATMMDGKVTRSRRKRLGSIGVTIVSILVFNTLFLLVLVKVLYDKSNMNISGQFQVYNQSIFPSDDGIDVPILEAEDRGIKLEVPTAAEDNEEEPKSQEGIKPDPKSIPSDENSVEEIMKKADEALRRSYQSVDDHDKKDDSVEDMEETADATEESSTSSHQPVPEMDGTHIPNDATETEMNNIEETNSGDVIVEEELIIEEEKMTEEEEAPAEEENVEKGEATSIKKAQINKGEQNAVDASDKPPLVCLIPFSENFIPECKYRAHKSSGSDQPPPQCWIPFSHMFLPECQSRVKKGMSTPLAGAEEWAWI